MTLLRKNWIKSLQRFAGSTTAAMAKLTHSVRARRMRAALGLDSGKPKKD
jgi:hypothetical protein